MNTLVNDFGQILDDWKQEPTYRLTYYTKENKKGCSISCPAYFESYDDIINAALNSNLGKSHAKGCKEVVISKYDFSCGCKLYDIETIKLNDL